MKDKIVHLKSKVNKLLYKFNTNKISIENMYFFITEQVYNNQVHTINDIKDIYPNINFAKSIKNLGLKNSKMYSYSLQIKNERLMISFLDDLVVDNIVYKLDIAREEKAYILKYKNNTKTNNYTSELASNLYNDNELSLEIKRNLSNKINENNHNIDTYIPVSTIYEQKEIYSDVKT